MERELYREQLTDAVQSAIDLLYTDGMTWEALEDAVLEEIDSELVLDECGNYYMFGEVFDDVVTALGIKAELLK